MNINKNENSVLNSSIKKRFFVTGTDTDVGKTLVTCGLLQAFKQQGLKTLGLKPLAAGCEKMDGQWCNEDALRLQSTMTEALSYQQVNPVALQEAIAPHLAAKLEGRSLSADRLAGMVRGAMMTRANITLVEGAGGWLVPLNARETLANVVHTLQLPVILVVGVRLGCLNHALLTIQAIQSAGLPLAGWVANCVDPSAHMINENIDSLMQRIAAPCLGVLPYLDYPYSDSIAHYFNTELLLQNEL